jgi:hypothetical protein
LCIIYFTGVECIKLPNLMLLNIEWTRVKPGAVELLYKSCPSLKSVTATNLLQWTVSPPNPEKTEILYKPNLFKVLNVENFSEFNLYKPNTCLFQTKSVPRVFGLDRFHCIRYGMVLTCMFAVNLFKIRSLHLLPIFYQLYHWTGDRYIELKYIVKRTRRARKWPLWAGDHYTKVTVMTGLTVAVHII